MKLIYLMTFNFLLIMGASAQTSGTNISSSSLSDQEVSSFFSKKKWSLDYLNYMNGPALSDDKGEYSINHYLTIKHKFNDDWYLSGTIRPDQKIGKQEVGQKAFTEGDSYLNLGLPSFYTNKNGAKIYSQIRYYAPLSEASKDMEIDGKIVTRVYAVASSGNFEYLYILIPTYYLNTKNVNGQIQYSHGHWTQASYKTSEKLSLDLAVYPSWSYSKGESEQFNDMPVYPGFTYGFTNNLSLSTYVEFISMRSESKTTMIGSSLSYKLF